MSVWPITVIPNPIDLNVWAPCAEGVLLGLPASCPLEKLELVVFGQNRPAQPPYIGFPIHYRGHLQDDFSLRLLYAAADVFVIPNPPEQPAQHLPGSPRPRHSRSGLPHKQPSRPLRFHLSGRKHSPLRPWRGIRNALEAQEMGYARFSRG